MNGKKPKQRKLQLNPEPLVVREVPVCARCRRRAPGCTCPKNPDYRWPDGTPA